LGIGRDGHAVARRANRATRLRGKNAIGVARRNADLDEAVLALETPAPPTMNERTDAPLSGERDEPPLPVRPAPARAASRGARLWLVCSEGAGVAPREVRSDRERLAAEADRLWPALEAALAGESGRDLVSAQPHSALCALVATALGCAPDGASRMRVDVGRAICLVAGARGWELHRSNVAPPDARGEERRA
jgi:hypothetical protein